MTPIVRTLAARVDMLDIYTLIGLDNPRAADRFLDCCERMFDLLARRPRMGRLRPEFRPKAAGFRSVLVSGMAEYVVFYRVAREGVIIVRVLHGARDLPRTALVNQR